MKKSEPSLKKNPSMTKLIRGNDIQLSSTPYFVGSLNPGGKASSEPQISLKKDGERIKEISVHCTCGRTIQIECEGSK